MGKTLEQSRLEKQAAKEKGLQNALEREKLEAINNKESEDVQKLQDMLDSLKG